MDGVCNPSYMHLFLAIFYFELAVLIAYGYKKFIRWENKRKRLEKDYGPTGLIISRQQFGRMIPTGPQCKLTDKPHAQAHADAGAGNGQTLHALNQVERSTVSDSSTEIPRETTTDTERVMDWSFLNAPPLTPPYDPKRCWVDPDWKAAARESYLFYNWGQRRSKAKSIAHVFGRISKTGRKHSRYWYASKLCDEFAVHIQWDNPEARNRFKVDPELALSPMPE